MPSATSSSMTTSASLALSHGGSDSCGCEDYSLLRANTGIATTELANPFLNGIGNMVTVLTAGSNGTIIKSIIIKAIEPNVTGIVRLFIRNADNTVTALYREIPMPVNPLISATPTPAPVLPMLEIDLMDELKLNAGFVLLASTQNAAKFNVIAEGLDWHYPETLPDSCCNFIQYIANTGVGIVSVANPNLNGVTGTYVPIFTASSTANGSIIKSITIAALQSTSINGMVRLFISTDEGEPYNLMMEIMVPQTNQSAFVPSFKVLMKENYHLQPKYIIGATTQTGDAFAITIEGEDWTYPIS